MDKIKANLIEYTRHWLSYGGFLLMLVLIDLAITGPFFKLIMTKLLQQGQVPVVSKLTAMELLAAHPLVLLGSLGCLGLWLIWLGIVWGLAIRGIVLLSQCRFSWPALLRNMSFWLRSDWIILVLIDFLWLMPLGQGLFCALRWGHLNYPALMLDFLTRKTWLLIIAVLFYLAVLTIGFLTLPDLVAMAADQITLKQAREKLNAGWQALENSLSALGGVLILSLFGWGLNHFLLLSLRGLEKFPGKWVWQIAIIFRSLMLGSGFWLLAGALVVMVLGQQSSNKRVKNRTAKYFPIWLGKGIWLTTAAMIVAASVISLPAVWHQPLAISHRGVTQNDGVQNTLPAAEKTRRLHPDYIEIDVHETADQKFVVMHDENLRQLTGVNREPRQLTLRQLQRLIADENGHHAHLVSFDQYLRFAQKHRQKLLVEIKTTPADSPRMLQHFNQRYGKRLQQNHAWLHSMDLRAVQELHRLNPKLEVMAIQPYVLGWPSRHVGWNVEYSMLNPLLIAQLHFNHQPICVWTVDDPDTMRQAALMGVDGIVTDNLKALDIALKDTERHHDYAARLAAQLNIACNWHDLIDGRR
ncbi:glycerophosphodiester phosphodiesterase [Limosilactobacillus mucosae]|uniref:glycerophosphodiester phosphodiesterase n=1 Tax=Limosilactobacillus mucosae TaxID=97478 RepID=UPI00233E767B|nr:glycerophosphodiester phosphodiesterase [Limosilactobacillus mucosae]MDC2845570.1 glycerophosphodiester phosphodiesterase [Limosilactobacillus mucosae]